jgi:hypothetical protein
MALQIAIIKQAAWSSKEGLVGSDEGRRAWVNEGTDENIPPR